MTAITHYPINISGSLTHAIDLRRFTGDYYELEITRRGPHDSVWQCNAYTVLSQEVLAYNWVWMSFPGILAPPSSRPYVTASNLYHRVSQLY